MTKNISISFLAASEAFGSYSQNYGNSLGCLSKDTTPVSIVGPFSVTAAEFTRQSWDAYQTHQQIRIFTPGLVLKFEKETYNIPDISFEQYNKALTKAFNKDSEMVQIDLRKIQAANQKSPKFPATKVPANNCSGYKR